MTLLNNNTNNYNNKEKMIIIIIIHFNVFHVTCMSHNKQKLNMCDKKCRTFVAQKYRMSVCETRACHRTKHKNIVSFVAQKSYLSPKKTEIAFVRQKNCLTRDIKLSPKNT